MSINLQIFRNSLTYDATASVPKILADLKEIAAINRMAAIKEKIFRVLLICFILGATLSIFISTLKGLVWILICGCFLIAAIFAGILMSQYGRLNFSNHRYELLKKILPLLERDMKNSANISVHLVCSPSTQKYKVNQTIHRFNQLESKIDYFRNDWLKIKGQFIDETRFWLTIDELNSIKYSSPTLNNDKTIYKLSSKFQGLDIIITLIFPRRQYGAVKILQNQLKEAIKITETAQIKRIKVTDKNMSLTVNLPNSVSDNQEVLYETINMMFLSIYQVLNLVRMLSKD